MLRISSKAKLAVWSEPTRTADALISWADDNLWEYAAARIANFRFARKRAYCRNCIIAGRTYFSRFTCSHNAHVTVLLDRRWQHGGVRVGRSIKIPLDTKLDAIFRLGCKIKVAKGPKYDASNVHERIIRQDQGAVLYCGRCFLDECRTRS